MVTGLLLMLEWLMGAGAALLATAAGLGLTACGLLFEVGAFFG